MLVREDDTIVCEPCYQDEGGEHIARPAHREVHARVSYGRCETCGWRSPTPSISEPTVRYDAAL